jgi:hypothetical protein
MNNELQRICDGLEEARVTSGELFRLIKLVHDAQIENEITGEWPENFTCTTYGAVRSAAVLMARHLNQLNDDLADDLQNEVRRRVKS